MINERFGELEKADSVFFIDPRDGERYKIVKIGNQIWMAENFRFKCDGSRAYRDNQEFIQEYGLLYNRRSSRLVAPEGWHLPSIEEFNQLEKYVGNVNLLKKKGVWKNDSSKDPFGFAAVPAGYCAQGFCMGLGSFTSYWTSSGSDFYLQGSYFEIGRLNYDELPDSVVDSISIRLVQDI